jgi:hypothetical protein
MADNNNFIEDMEAGEMILWIAIIGLAVYFLFFWQGGLVTNFESGVGGIWNGLVNLFTTGTWSTQTPGAVDSAGGNLSTPEASAETWNAQYLASINPGANPFDPSVYSNNSSNANITPATAQSIASTVYNAGGSFFSSGDITSVVPAFQNNCESWLDVSQVAQQFQASENQDLLTYMIAQFNNGNGSSSNNGQQLQSLIQWCVSLPQS